MSVHHNQLQPSDKIHYFGASSWQPAKVIWKDSRGILIVTEEKNFVQLQHHNGLYNRIVSDSEMSERKRVIEQLENKVK